MAKNIFLIWLLCTFVVFGKNISDDSISVIISVEGFENDKGTCRLLLFESEKGFPDAREYAKMMLSKNILERKVEFVFKIYPGNYAVSVLHDENMNGKMDKNWLGIPKEGFGASNNPKIGFGPPDFEEAIATFDKKIMRIKIKLIYM